MRLATCRAWQRKDGKDKWMKREQYSLHRAFVLTYVRSHCEINEIKFGRRWRTLKSNLKKK